jgi:hypothetical protein
MLVIIQQVVVVLVELAVLMAPLLAVQVVQDILLV